MDQKASSCLSDEIMECAMNANEAEGYSKLKAKYAKSQKRVAELEKQLYFASLPNAELEPERWDNEPKGR